MNFRSPLPGLLAVLVLLLPLSAAAEDAVAGKVETAPVPVQVDRGKLAGTGLTEWPPFPENQLLEGTGKHRGHVSFSGDELVTEIWEGGPGKLSIESFPYEEFVLVLSGKLILTDAEGNRTEYSEGDALVVPKGFTGVWEMPVKYRELVVIEKEAYVRVEGEPQMETDPQ